MVLCRIVGNATHISPIFHRHKLVFAPVRIMAVLITSIKSDKIRLVLFSVVACAFLVSTVLSMPGTCAKPTNADFTNQKLTF